MRELLITSLPLPQSEPKNSIITSIFPNPTQSTLHIEFKEDQWENVKAIEIIDAKGIIVYQQNQVNERLFKLSMDGVAAGIYSVKINTANHIEVKRFIKH